MIRPEGYQFQYEKILKAASAALDRCVHTFCNSRAPLLPSLLHEVSLPQLSNLRRPHQDVIQDFP